MTITPNDIKERFIRYNEMYFEGALKMCNFSVYKAQVYELARFQARQGSTQPRISIAKQPFPNVEWTEKLLKQAIVHEMVHYYVSDILKRNTILCPHGVYFRKTCWHIYKRYGYKINYNTYINRLFVLKKKEHLNIWNRIELLYLKPINYLLGWIF